MHQRQIAKLAQESMCGADGVKAVMHDHHGPTARPILLPVKRSAWNVICSDYGKGKGSAVDQATAQGITTHCKHTTSGDAAIYYRPCIGNSKTEQSAKDASAACRNLSQEELADRAGSWTKAASMYEDEKLWNRPVKSFASLMETAHEDFGAESFIIFNSVHIKGSRFEPPPLVSSDMRF